MALYQKVRDIAARGIDGDLVNVTHQTAILGIHAR